MKARKLLAELRNNVDKKPTAPDPAVTLVHVLNWKCSVGH